MHRLDGLRRVHAVGHFHPTAVLTISGLIVVAVAHPALAHAPTGSGRASALVALPSQNLAALHAPATGPAE